MVGTAHADPLVGSMLGKDYRVLEQIGMGGMAVVYLVEHQTLLKQFAAKVLSTEHASSVEARARFTQEAHAASQLDHENIVTISDFGITADSRPYFVMELLRGKTLAARIDEGPMTLEEVVAVSVPVARALAHAHAEGIIHRDVKPENIFLVQRSQNRWTVKVLDFGIAKVPLNDRMTKTGQALGSPMFMAPEACRGDDVDQRADVYSYGILLYLMLAGRVPFEDQNLLKVLQMQVSSPLPLPSSFNADLPPPIESVIIRALAKDPDDRYPTMDAMLLDFEAALPNGADMMLLQAQFGVAQTPFPGSLERVRNSGLFAAVTTGQHASVTGRHLTTTGKHRVDLGPTMPLAPRSGSGSKIVLVLVALLLVGGAVGGTYFWMEHTKAGAPPAVAAAAKMEEAKVMPAAVAPVAAPPVEPAIEPAIEAVPEPEPEPAPAPEVVAKPPPVVDKRRKQPPPKRLATTAKQVKATKPVIAPPPPTPVVSPPRATGSNTGSATVVAANPEPPKPTPSPVVAPAPSTTVAPPIEPKPEAIKKPDRGSMDATPSIASLDVSGSLPTSAVQRGVERVLPALRDCYRAAAKAQQATSAVSVALNFEIDETSTARSVSAKGAAFGSLTSCAKSAVGRVQTRLAPDVGTVHVVLVVKFTPV